MTLAELLREMGFLNLQNEYITPRGISVDILMPIPPGNVVIEVDGPFHFLSDGNTPSGATVFKRRLLERDGYMVCSVNVMKEWRELKTREEQIKYVKSMLDGKLRSNN